MKNSKDFSEDRKSRSSSLVNKSPQKQNSYLKQFKNTNNLEEEPVVQEPKKSAKKLDKQKVEDFIKKNSYKEEVPKRNTQPIKGKKPIQEKPKFKTYSQIHKEKLQPQKPSLIEEIYGDVASQRDHEKPSENIKNEDDENGNEEIREKNEDKDDNRKSVKNPFKEEERKSVKDEHKEERKSIKDQHQEEKEEEPKEEEEEQPRGFFEDHQEIEESPIPEPEIKTEREQ